MYTIATTYVAHIMKAIYSICVEFTRGNIETQTESDVVIHVNAVNMQLKQNTRSHTHTQKCDCTHTHTASERTARCIY